MLKKTLKAYYDQLSKEAWIKSGLCGICAGFSVAGILSLIFWFTNAQYYWISIVAGVWITGGVAAACYYFLFQPTPRKIARRVDDLGLEERLLTMTQFEHDDSFMARRQREDTMLALSKVSVKLLTLMIPVLLIVGAAVGAVFGIGMTTVSGLAANGIIGDGNSFIDEITKDPPKEFTVQYFAGEGGEIDGLMEQVVLEGQDSEGVLAVDLETPEGTYIFVGWSDGYGSPYRVDKNVTKDIEVTALFQLAELPEDDEITDEAGPSDKPGEEQNGTPQPSDKPGEPTDQPPKPSDQEQSAARDESKNQIRDGETYYGDEFEDAFSDAMDEVAQDGDLSKGEKDVIGDYFGGIQN